MFLVVLLLVLVAWIGLSALAIVSMRVFWHVWDTYGIAPALALLVAQGAFIVWLL
jgi:hypothetical protein